MAGAMTRMWRPGDATTPAATASPLTSSYNLYNRGVEQQAGDYSDIMKRYQDYYNQVGGAGKPLYNQSEDSRKSLGTLNELSTTGGYGADDIANLRERGISPIRSVYASANRDIDRQKALQGGFSPNYTASKAKMARDMSSGIANQMTKVNADIAQQVASNRLAAAAPYASAAQSENELRNRYDTTGLQLQGQALQGMTSLYGTTPALASLFGNQALQGSELQNTINQGNTASQNNTLRTIASMLGGI